MHKLRDAMGQREDIYKLDNEVELDEMFFDVATDADVSLKRGAGSQAKAKVVVMAGVRTPSEEAAAYKLAGGKSKVGKSVNFIKMRVVSDISRGTVEACAKQSALPTADVTTDGHASHSGLNKIFASHESYSENRFGVKAIVKKHLPWVHLIAGRCKDSLAGIHGQVSRLNLQRYLDEFCYKFNRRRFGDSTFDRLVVACISTTPRVGFRNYNFV